jgi:hypothetical protein
VADKRKRTGFEERAIRYLSTIPDIPDGVPDRPGELIPLGVVCNLCGGEIYQGQDVTITDLVFTHVNIADCLSNKSVEKCEHFWRPISTAAKEVGKAVLLCNCQSKSVWVGAWRLPRLGESYFETYYEYEWRDSSGRWATPTHWQPIPQLPYKAGGRNANKS